MRAIVTAILFLAGSLGSPTGFAGGAEISGDGVIWYGDYSRGMLGHTYS